MLVLARKPEQSIIIGNNIKITLIEIRGKIAKLGIDAPKDIEVHREEIFVKILEQNNAKI